MDAVNCWVGSRQVYPIIEVALSCDGAILTGAEGI